MSAAVLWAQKGALTEFAGSIDLLQSKEGHVWQVHKPTHSRLRGRQVPDPPAAASDDGYAWQIRPENAMRLWSKISRSFPETAKGRTLDFLPTCRSRLLERS